MNVLIRHYSHDLHRKCYRVDVKLLNDRLIDTDQKFNKAESH